MFSSRMHGDLALVRRVAGPARLSLAFLTSILLFVFAGFGQILEPPDWKPVEARLKQTIANGTVEEKRDALFEIRNYRSEQASRIAALALSDPDEMVRATAAASVVFLPEPEAAQLLIPLLSDRRPFVRRETALALGTVGYTPSVARLVETLRKDKDPEVRTAAAISIGLTGGIDDTPALVELLRQKPAEENEMLRRAAVRSLGQIAEYEFTGHRPVNTPHSFLPQQLKHPDRSSHPNDRHAVSDAGAETERLLVSILTSDREAADIKREAAFALGAFRYKAAIPVLEDQLRSDDPYLVEICREALEKIKTQE